MRAFCESCFTILLLLNVPLFASASDEISCACAAQDHDFDIDCDAVQDDPTILSDALALLSQNSCSVSCASNSCEKAYFIVQSHHDYCPSGSLSESATTGYHSFQGACQDCTIARKRDPNLGNCAAPECGSQAEQAANGAYAFLLKWNCMADCSLGMCGDNFQTLRAMYDGCPGEEMPLLARLGFNTYLDYCAAQDCNVVASDSSDPLVCSTTPTTTTPAPTPTGKTPFPTPANPCPVPKGNGCSVCGDNKCITKPEEIFQYGDYDPLSCKTLEEAGNEGIVPLDQCGVLPNLINNLCGCSPATTYYSPTGTPLPTPTEVIPTSRAPTRAPTRVPTRAPTPAPADAPNFDYSSYEDDEDDSTSGGLNAGGVIGIVAGVIVGGVFIFMTVCFANKYKERKESIPVLNSEASGADEQSKIDSSVLT